MFYRLLGGTGNKMKHPNIEFRFEVEKTDAEIVREIAESTGFFSPEEVDITVELVNERLLKGDASGYHFIFALKDNRVIGYTCFGPIPATRVSYDLYWIVVHKDFQRIGLGVELMKRSEAAIASRGGRRIYVDTSSREQYAPTHNFYLRCGYIKEAVLKDFYYPGDSKAIFSKVIGPPA